MLKAIIFDLDGVIVDSHAAHKKAWKALLQSLGREIPEPELEYVVEGHKREKILRHFLGEVNEQEARRYGALKDRFFHEMTHEITTISGVCEFFDRAECDGLALAVGTSAGRKRAEQMLDRIGLRQRLQAIVTGDEVLAGKPDPAVFRIAAERLGVAPENALVCEDATAGIQAAKSAGMKCLGIAANGRSALLEMAGADWVIADFTQVNFDDLKARFMGQEREAGARTAYN